MEGEVFLGKRQLLGRADLAKVKDSVPYVSLETLDSRHPHREVSSVSRSIHLS